MKLFLIATKGKMAGTPVPIKVDLFMIGTATECQMRAKRDGVGAQHCCVVTRDNKKVFVRDLDCGEPTVVNGENIPTGGEWPLHAGDRLAVGPLEFLVQFHEKPLSGRDLEEWALKCLDDDDSSKGLHEAYDEDDVFNPANRATHNAADAASVILDQLQVRRGIVMGRLRVGLDAGITVVRFNDVYLVDEAEIALVKKELYDHVSRPNLRILLDFKNVRRMSSTAVEMVREVYQFVRRFGSTMVLCRIRPELQSILATLSVGQTLRHFADKRQALAARW
jgi:anti-anti-sigma regulatory factor